MAPSNNRRLGVDSRIIQAAVVRGYDTTILADPAQDLVITPGQNSADLSVSRVILSNRTNDPKPIFILAPGSDISTADLYEFYALDVADPNGAVSSPLGSLLVSNNPPALWQNQDGGTVWKKISDDLGGEDLAETLVIGNTSGPTDIVMSKVAGPTLAARVRGQSTNDGTDGGPLLLLGGDALGVAGNGGNVVVASGTSAAGNTGNALVGSFNTAVPGASSGLASLSTGTADGNTGAVSIQSGNSGRDAGDITVLAGSSTGTTGGSILVQAGNGPIAGGSVTIRSGAPLSGNLNGTPIALFAAQGVGTGIGGAINIRAGNGGPGGGQGGSIFLTCGPGGGGADKGQIVGDGFFTADNYKFGMGNPNVLGVSGREGSLFQNTTAGQGEQWVNTNGSPLGWKKLAFAADFINSFSRMQYGNVVPALNNPGLPVDDYADSGLYEGVEVLNVGATQTRTVDSFGPVMSLSTILAGSQIGWSIAANTAAIRRDHRFVAVFKISNTTTESRQRIAVGLSTASLATHLSTDEPAGAEYITLTKKDAAANWVFLTRGPGGPQSQILSTIASSVNAIRYAVFDFTDSTQAVFRFLDESFNVIDQKTATGLNIPQVSSNLYPLCGVRQEDVNPVGLKFYLASVITEADEILSAGNSIANQTLQQVLTVGNETGGTNIIVTDGDFIVGEDDAKLPGGGDMTIFSGGVTTVAGNTGFVRIQSQPNAVALSSGNTGVVTIGSGNVFQPTSTGDTGNVTVLSGKNSGTGDSGDIIIGSGQILGSGQAGDIEISVGQGLVSTGPVGDLILNGGSSSTTAGGDIFINGGDSVAPSGLEGGVITLTTGSGDPTGNTNGGRFLARTANGAGSGSGGRLTLQSGAGGPTGTGGLLDIFTSNSVGTSGKIEIYSGNGTTAGEVDVRVGSTSGGDGVRLRLKGGDGSVGGGGTKGGDVLLEPGMADEPGLIEMRGFVFHDAPAFKYGSVSLNGSVTDVNGDLNLVWGGPGPLSGFTAFPFGVIAVSLVSIYDPSFLVHVRAKSTNALQLELRFYDAAGAALSGFAFGANAILTFQTYVHN